MTELTEERKAANALLYFRDGMDVHKQWERAVDFLREMDNMQKAGVWNLIAEPGIDEVKLSKRRTAYKRAVRDTEGYSAGDVHVGLSEGGGDRISTLEKANMELVRVLWWWSKKDHRDGNDADEGGLSPGANISGGITPAQCLSYND
jgi:hypothetical protein